MLRLGPTLTDLIQLGLGAVLCLVAQSGPTLCNPMDCSPPGWGSPGKNTGMGCHAVLQGSNPGLLYYRQILYQLNHQGNPKTLE